MSVRTLFALVGVAACAVTGSVRAAEALIAVATNFADAMARLESGFERESGHRLVVVTGATGKLFAQISSGAPFDVLLAADGERPARLEAAGLAVPGSRFTYAVGRLALWSRDPHMVPEDGVELLRTGTMRKLAIANPALAPYGQAAWETLEALGVLERLQPHVVMGENIGQAHALVATGNAEVGLVALAQLVATGALGSRWEVPCALHAPIRQDAVLLRHGSGNPAAEEFLAYLTSAEAGRLIAGLGYESGCAHDRCPDCR